MGRGQGLLQYTFRSPMLVELDWRSEVGPKPRSSYDSHAPGPHTVTQTHGWR